MGVKEKERIGGRKRVAKQEGMTESNIIDRSAFVSGQLA